ncbi:MAG: hypothetical protein KC613_16690 [Myxococcales bacterium]|nr:hypothetical protein [Myxococcales bacterium]
MLTRLGLCFVPLAAALALACAGRPADKDKDLKEAVKLYNQHQRWGDFRTAARWVAPDKAEAWLAARQRASQIRVADMQLLQILPGDPPDTAATAIVQLSWYTEPSMRLESSTRRQVWTKLESGWRVTEEGVVETPAPQDGPDEGQPSWP